MKAFSGGGRKPDQTDVPGTFYSDGRWRDDLWQAGFVCPWGGDQKSFKFWEGMGIIRVSDEEPLVLSIETPGFNEETGLHGDRWSGTFGHELQDEAHPSRLASGIADRVESRYSRRGGIRRPRVLVCAIPAAEAYPFGSTTRTELWIRGP